MFLGNLTVHGNKYNNYDKSISRSQMNRKIDVKKMVIKLPEMP